MFDFLTALEVARKSSTLGADKEEEVAESGEKLVLHGVEH